MATDEVNIKIAGAAGLGINVTGRILSKLFMRSGYFTYDYTEYPSLIKGGLNTYQVRASINPVLGPNSSGINIYLALDETAADPTHFQPDKNCIVISEHAEKIKSAYPSCQYLIPQLLKIVKSCGGKPVMINNAALGIISHIFNLDENILIDLVRETFSGKATEIITENIKVAQAGYRQAQTKFNKFKIKLSLPQHKATKLHLSGNEAAGLAAIAAECRFFAGYPMTPASSLMHFVANYGRQSGLIVKHAEDELSSINMVLGASYTGVRAMTGTSGGGFALMNEALSLAGISETPVVIFVAQRAGPATGMPTWTEQGELLYSVFAGHGEFPKIVLTPANHSDIFELTQTAFNLADQIQTPVIILSDKMLSESYQSVPKTKLKQLPINRGSITKRADKYQRYRLTQNGISPRNFPGIAKTPVIVNSYEHDETGYTTEDSKTRTQMVNKRAKKILSVAAALPQPLVYGSKSPQVTLISAGSTYGALKEAVDQLNTSGIKSKLIQIRTLWPIINKKPFTRLLGHNSTVISVENNSTGQLAHLLRLANGQVMDAQLLKYNGRPFEPSEILAFVKKHIAL